MVSNAPLVDALQETARPLAAQGHEIVEAAPEFDLEAWSRATHVAWMGFLASGVAGLSQVLGVQPSTDNLEAATLACAEAGMKLTGLDYEMALMQLNAVSRAPAGLHEPTLLQLARDPEGLRPWAGPRPPVFAI